MIQIMFYFIQQNLQQKASSIEQNNLHEKRAQIRLKGRGINSTKEVL